MVADESQPTGLPRISGENVSLDELASARRQSWIARSNRGLEILRFRQSLVAMDHPDLEKGAAFQRRLDDVGITEGQIREDWNQIIVATEGEQRRHLRTPMIALFRSSQINKLKQAIREIVEQVFDEVEDPTNVDFMRDVAWKIPSRVYCYLVAAPMEHAAYVAKLSDSTVSPILLCDTSRRQESIDTFNASKIFVKEHLDERRRQGALGEDFASLLIRQELEGLLTAEELVFEGISILHASVDNTVHQMGLTFATLLEDPQLWNAVREDARLVMPATDEAMRLRPRIGTIPRYSPRDTELEGVPVPADSWVFVSTRAANRDETMFEDADSFRFDRRVGRVLQFGAGQYNCVGQTLARLELHELMHVVRERFPSIALKDKWSCHETSMVTEVTSLQVRL